MKRIILLLLLIGCTKEVPKEEIYELPLKNPLLKTTGTNVILDADVYPLTMMNGTFYAINLYSNVQVDVDYKVVIRWLDDKVYVDEAKMPYHFTEWTTSTLFPTHPYHHIQKPVIVSVICPDPKYSFKW